MKKLRLDIDALQVESFDPTSAQDPLRGTVDGLQIEPAPLSRRISECFVCATNRSCFISCNGTCLQTCDATCACPSQNITECGCPVLQTQYCDTRLCPIESTRACLVDPGV